MKSRQIKELIKNEEQLLYLKKISRRGIWDSIYVDDLIIGAILFLLLIRKNDYLIITTKRLLVIKKNNITENLTYSNLNNLEYNSISENISYKNSQNEMKIITLSFLRLTYSEIQRLKKLLN